MGRGPLLISDQLDEDNDDWSDIVSFGQCNRNGMGDEDEEEEEEEADEGEQPNNDDEATDENARDTPFPFRVLHRYSVEHPPADDGELRFLSQSTLDEKIMNKIKEQASQWERDTDVQRTKKGTMAKRNPDLSWQQIAAGPGKQCIQFKINNSGASLWTSGIKEGLFACKGCTVHQRPCFKRHGQHIYLLPLNPILAESQDPSALGYHIITDKERSFGARKDPVFAKRKSGLERSCWTVYLLEYSLLTPSRGSVRFEVGNMALRNRDQHQGRQISVHHYYFGLARRDPNHICKAELFHRSLSPMQVCICRAEFNAQR